MAFVNVCVHNRKLAVKGFIAKNGGTCVNIVDAATHEGYVGMTLQEAERLQEEMFQLVVRLRTQLESSAAEEGEELAPVEEG